MENELVKLTQQLIRIRSQNPGGSEREIALFIREYLKNLGVRSRIYEFKKDRANVVCTLKSRHSKKKLLLTPHTDTVPAGRSWRFDPFSATVHKGRIYGRGATDCKANVAVSLYLIKKLREEKIRLENLDLLFAFCADEETGSRWGIKPLLAKLPKLDYAVALDSNDFKIIIAQKGLLHLRCEVFGKKAHGAYPERGISAIEKAIRILNDILKHKFKHRHSQLLKKPTLNIGTIEGGDKVNIVADYVSFELDIRYLPSMDYKKIIHALERYFNKHDARYKITITTQQEPTLIDKNSFLIRTLSNVLRDHRIKVRCEGIFGATVLTFLEEKHISSFAFGFGSGGCAHQEDEYVKISNLKKGVSVLEEYLARLDNATGKQ